MCFRRVKGHIGRPGPTCQNIPIQFNEENSNDGMASKEPNHEENSLGNHEPENEHEPENDGSDKHTGPEQVEINKALQQTLTILCSQMKELTTEVLTLKQQVPTNVPVNTNGGSSAGQSGPNDQPTPGGSGGANPGGAGGARTNPGQHRSSETWDGPLMLELPTPVRTAMAKPPEGTSGTTRGNSNGTIEYYFGSVGGATSNSSQELRRQHQIEFLKPLGPNILVDREVLVPGIEEQTIRSALAGEYILLDGFLTNFAVNMNFDGKENSGRGEGGRPRRGRRWVYNFQTWNEAWTNYERLMVSYHGADVHKYMSKYRLRILDLDRKHYWSCVQKFDVKYRNMISGFTVRFTPIDSELLNEELGPTTIRLNAQRCDYCGGYDHFLLACPFYDVPGLAPGAGRGRGTANRNIQGQICFRYNERGCYDPSCARLHKCWNCRGELPAPQCEKRGPCSQSYQGDARQSNYQNQQQGQYVPPRN